MWKAVRTFSSSSSAQRDAYSGPRANATLLPPRGRAEAKGRIQFAKVSSSLVQLCCDECSVHPAVRRCDACALLYCLKCLDLCHASISFGEVSPHTRSFRCLEESDVGRPFLAPDEFSLPNAPFYEVDMQRRVDVTLPLSLCSFSDTSRSTAAFVQPLFGKGDVVLFTDPSTRAEAYGSIVSNVSIRNADASDAPVIRGQDSVILYEVEIQGAVENIRSLLPELLGKTGSSEAGAIALSVEEVTDIQHRRYLYMALDLNNKASIAKEARIRLAGGGTQRRDHSRIVVLKEAELESPQQRLSEINEGRRFAFELAIHSVLRKLQYRLLKSAFDFLYRRCRKLTARLRLRSCIRLQGWLRKLKMRLRQLKLEDSISAAEFEKWRKLNEACKFASCADVTAVTMDGVHFFRSVCDLDRYFAFQRKMSLVCLQYLHRKVLHLFGVVFRQWRGLISGVVESSRVLSSHVEPNVFQSSEGEEWLPPSGSWHPSVGQKLPPLRALYSPKSAEEKLTMVKTRRLDYCAFKPYSEGPTDFSCWVVPGVLAMGRAPLGNARKGSGVEAIAALVLAGCNCFVSAMEEEEEGALEKTLNVEPCSASIEHAAAKARIGVIKTITENNLLVDEQTKILNKTHEPLLSNPNYYRLHRDRLRITARIRLACQSMDRARSQLRKLPSSFEWVRMALSPIHVPLASDLEYLLRDIEQRIREGKVVYVYSKDCHGRAGMLACCLLGRMYGLSAQDALYRIQACHDCMEVECRRDEIVHCPQTPAQRSLVEEIVQTAYRSIEGAVTRSRLPQKNNE